MRKKIFALFIVLTMIFTLTIPTIAEELIEVRLNQAINGETPYAAGNKFDHMDCGNVWNGYNIDVNNPNVGYTFWHLISNGGTSEFAKITFLEADGETETLITIAPSEVNDSTSHYCIIAPADWKISDGYSFYSYYFGNPRFTISHSGRHDAVLGSLKVTVDVSKEHDEVTYQPIWQKEIQPIWQKEYQPIWQKEIQPIWQKEYQPIWQREIQPIWQKEYQPIWQKEIQPIWQKEIQPVWQKVFQPIWQRELQPYNVPTFEKEISYASASTLVTRLDYSDDTVKAIPMNGGAFKNGHTYVKLIVADASETGGVWYTIADSSTNNGKKTPAQYNFPIDYKYNVKITDGKLTISLDDRLVSASVGAYVVKDIKKFPGNAPPHYPNTVTVDMPQDPGEYVYLYVHFQGGIRWYTTGAYEFVGWRYDHTDTIRDEFVENKLVSDSFVRNDIAKDYFVRDDNAKDYFVRNDLVSDRFIRNSVISDSLVYNDLVSDRFIRNDVKDYFVRNDVAEDYFVRDDVAKDYFVRNDFIGRETVIDSYNVMFNLVVTNNADGQEVYSGQIANLGEVAIPNLNSGVYTVTLSGSDIGTRTKTVTVTAPSQAVVTFDDIPTVIGDVENFYLAPIYLGDIYLDKTYLDDIYLDKTYLGDIYLDKTYLDDSYLDKTYLDDIYLDKTYLDDIYLDKTYLDDIYLDKTYLDDIYLDKTYLDDQYLPMIYLPDIVNAPINLGNDTDPFGPYAMRLN